MTDLIYYTTFFSLTLLVSLYLNGYLNRLFVGNKLTDPINERSSHNYPATRSGGLSLFFTVCVASTFAVATKELSIPLYVLLSVFFMTLTGFADDLIEVRYREKLFLQVFAGLSYDSIWILYRLVSRSFWSVMSCRIGFRFLFLFLFLWL